MPGNWQLSPSELARSLKIQMRIFSWDRSQVKADVAHEGKRYLHSIRISWCMMVISFIKPLKLHYMLIVNFITTTDTMPCKKC